MMERIEFIIAVVLAVGTAFVIAVLVHGDPTVKLKLAFEYGMLVLLILFGFMILAAIASGKIDISQLLSEGNGAASMSRFQLLIFTFVIGISFFLVVVCECKLPEVPANVLALLGISASTYGVSKGIQATTGVKGKGAPDVSDTGKTKN